MSPLKEGIKGWLAMTLNTYMLITCLTSLLHAFNGYFGKGVKLFTICGRKRTAETMGSRKNQNYNFFDVIFVL